MMAMPELSPDQRRAVQSDAPLLIVAAGAGTGKTTTLVSRAVRLVESARAQGGMVLAVTFTVAAAREMMERLKAASPDAESVLEARTLHSLAWRVCTADRRLRRDASALLSEEEALAWVEEILAQSSDLALPVGHRREGEPLAQAVLRLFLRWGENGVTPEEAASPRLGFPPDVADAYARFMVRKAAEGRVDFADVIQWARHALEMRDATQVPWRFVLVDEAQDLNQAQIALVNALCRSADGLTLVGDDDQSLYAFRGATPRLLADAEKHFPAMAARGVERVALRENRRCPNEVLVPAVALVNRNRRAQPKVLASARSGEAPIAHVLSDEREEAAFVGWRVGYLLDAGAPPSSIAILARTDAGLRQVEAELLARHVPAVLRKGSGLLESAVARDVVAWLTLAVTPDAVAAFRRIHDRPARGLGRRLALRVADLADASGCGVREALEQVSSSSAAAERPALLDMADVLGAIEDVALAGGSPRAVLAEVLRLSGYEEWAKRSCGGACPEELRLLDAIADTAADLDDFLLSVCASQDSDWKTKDDAVSLATLHGAKGLEWDHVIIVGAHADAMPHVRARDEFETVRSRWPVALLTSDPLLTIGRGGVEEERRLFHVGLTRARQSVVITCPASVRRASKIISVPPSPFLGEAGIPFADPPLPGRVWQGARRGTRRRGVDVWKPRGSVASSDTPVQPALL